MIYDKNKYLFMSAICLSSSKKLFFLLVYILSSLHSSHTDGFGCWFKARRPSHVKCFISISTLSLKWFSCCPHAVTCFAFLKQTHLSLTLSRKLTSTWTMFAGPQGGCKMVGIQCGCWRISFSIWLTRKKLTESFSESDHFRALISVDIELTVITKR